MKITPIVLFLILLFVLTLSIVFSSLLPLNMWTSEGFVTYGLNKPPRSYVYIPQYSSNKSSIVKLYDNLFYDTTNANLIEVTGTVFNGSVNVSGTGYGDIRAIDGNGNAVTATSGNLITNEFSITGAYVMTRDGRTNGNAYTATGRTSSGQIIAVDTIESQVNTIASSYNNATYNTHTTSGNPNQYEVLYMPWNRNTYVHVIQTAPTTSHILSACFGDSDQVMDYKIYGSLGSISSTAPATDNDDKNNSSVIIPSYYNGNTSLYQISHTVLFDIQNANLVINNNGTLKVYNRYGNDQTSTYNANYQPNITNVDFAPWMVPDAAGNMVLYMPNYTKTMVAIISLNSDQTGGKFRIANLVRFNQRGVDSAPSAGTPASAAAAATAVSAAASAADISGNRDVNSDFYRMLAYWNTVYSGSLRNPNDYILKTQIVPPVCPTCPSCPSSGACTNCGGNGGAGALSGQGQPIVAAGTAGGTNYGSSGNFYTNANANTLGGATTLLTLGAVSGAQNIASTGGNVLNNAIDTTGNVLTTTGSGAANLLTSAGSGASNLLTSAGSGATNLLRSAGSGVAGVLTPQQQQQQLQYGSSYGQPQQYGSSYGQPQQYGSSYGQAQQPQGVQRAGVQPAGAIPGVDIHSQYGASASRGSNFVPVTASFSSFGK